MVSSSERLSEMMQSLKLDLSGIIVDTKAKASDLVDELCALPSPRRKLYLDFEGVNLCREGQCCIGQLTVPKDASGECRVALAMKTTGLARVVTFVWGRCRCQVRDSIPAGDIIRDSERPSIHHQSATIRASANTVHHQSIAIRELLTCTEPTVTPPSCCRC